MSTGCPGGQLSVCAGQGRGAVNVAVRVWFVVGRTLGPSQIVDGAAPFSFVDVSFSGAMIVNGNAPGQGLSDDGRLEIIGAAFSLNHAAPP